MTGAGNNVLRKIAGTRKGERSFRNGTEIPTQVKHSYDLSNPDVRNHFQKPISFAIKGPKASMDALGLYPEGFLDLEVGVKR
jgi:hypothetical protein